MTATRWLRRVIPAVIVLIAGCSEPEAVRVYDDPVKKSPTASPVPEEQKQFRTLAAMVPADFGGQDSAGWWFLKMSGPALVIDKYKADFDKLLDTVRAAAGANEPTITWDLPQGWKQEEGGGAGFAKRFATLKAPGGDAEIAVSLARGTIVGNAQRWWNQLWGEERPDDITPATLETYVKRRVVKERLVFRVDMAGPHDPNAKRPMMNPHGGG